MKIIITGSLGHISKPLTATLVQSGHIVTVISSNPEKQKEIEALGATAAIGSLQDAEFITTTFTGADAVYTMVPPANYFDHGLDLVGYYHQLGRNYAAAIEKTGIKQVVNLSTFGADLEKGSGILLGAHGVEGILNRLPADIAITHMRPTSFYYNLYAYTAMIKSQSVIAANYGADDVIPWVSPIDIAAAIAEEITTPSTGRKVRYVASEELTCNQTATILGAAIGKPDLKWTIITDDQMRDGLVAAGMHPGIAAGMAEMYGSLHNGVLATDYYRHKPEMGKVKLTDFAKEFATAYNAK
ncbi:NmrA family NAD(P)-binding protein [Mucilaginibacter aquaedulcis]|uniref:NmrA family NAD(P)-binding protein n=1 Tax=Mucilaginibacter aquaedulcis TaxID=1187081 RepID=UPI0025B49871|nr:NAD(P)H-binding protein [Mucilaginibacter aquaedulcis]MDN3551725.1 NAD(P)H-binding protein [Mucilaginibacter aquaedulcis]